MTPTVVFLGPTLPEADARQVVPDAEYAAPIARGDLPRAVAAGVGVVAIIDGVFHQRLPVTPAEIRDALRAGVTVFGASSMGALRAAEMHSLGMIGVGTIFEWYRRGQVLGEHEVAVAFDPATARALTVPLVNMRHAFSRAVAEHVATPQVADRLLEIAKSLHYTELTYDAVLAIAGWEAVMPAGFTRASFKRYLAGIDLKREDALACLRAVSYCSNHRPGAGS